MSTDNGGEGEGIWHGNISDSSSTGSSNDSNEMEVVALIGSGNEKDKNHSR